MINRASSRTHAVIFSIPSADIILMYIHVSLTFFFHLGESPEPDYVNIFLFSTTWVIQLHTYTHTHIRSWRCREKHSLIRLLKRWRRLTRWVGKLGASECPQNHYSSSLLSSLIHLLIHTCNKIKSRSHKMLKSQEVQCLSTLFYTSNT